MSCVCHCMMMSWVRDPLYPSSYSPTGVGLHGRSSWYNCTRLKCYLYLVYLQDLILYLSFKVALGRPPGSGL
jgi:hypothetical protein